MRKDRTVFPVEVSVRHISHKEKDYHIAIVRDITERRETESRIMLSNAFLKLFSRTFSHKEYLNSAVKLIKEWAGCRCVGIRLLDDRRNIPYESYTGFSKDFWKKIGTEGRFAAAWEMVVEADLFRGKNASQPRLQRSVQNIQRRKR